ncbi:hypothetical protein N0B44_07690 [Roseibacterium beibuensis]|uniref:hypothetical protein n=1 Tax=[Roseibacterium] beibuensis TaxID=1193142 RepID=UPI00217CCD96|nr:hypothetical protein [Roseibacterium beibuensis]MCS6622787.1 hypothetical protein [Roseibacterium beibuensis]
MFAAVLTGAPQADTRPAAYTNAEACLRDNAAAANAVSTGAADAATFLLDYLCAGPVSAAAAWQRNTELLESMRGMMDQMASMDLPNAAMMEAEAAAVEVDSETEELIPVVIEEPESFTDMFGDFDDIHVDPVSGELVVGEGAGGTMVSAIRAQSGAVGQLLGDSRPVFLRELAGRLVLEARSGR